MTEPNIPRQKNELKHTPHPSKPPFHPENIPIELKELSQWVLWRYVWNNKKWDKPPCQANGQLASVSNRATWMSFDKALQAIKTKKFDGVGFIPTAEDGLCGWDFDNSFSGGKINEKVVGYIKNLNSYVEVSPSGKGLRVWVKAKIPNNKKKGDFEVYDNAHYLTVTGNVLPRAKTSIEETETTSVYEKIFGIEPTPIIAETPKKTKFDMLWVGEWKEAGYPSQSEADLALCNLLAIKLDPVPARVDAFFRKSGLMRSKWNEKHGNETYGETTVGKACKREKVVPGRTTMESHNDATHRLCWGDEEENWLVEGWLPQGGCGMAVGSPKNFKTWLSIDLALAVVMGRPFMGQYPVLNKGPVLMVQLEDPMRSLIKRSYKVYGMKEPVEKGTGKNRVYELDFGPFKKLGDGNYGVDWPLHWIRDFNFKDKTTMEQLERRIVECRPALIIIDSLYVAAGKIEDFLAGMAAAELNELKRLRDKHGCAFLIVHHSTWAGRKSEDIASMWGSIYLYAWLDFGWMVLETSKKKEGEVRIKRYFKEAEEPDIIRAIFTIDNWSYTVKIGADDVPVNKKIEEAIMGGGRYDSERAIANAINSSPATVHRAARKIGLEKDEEGCYIISPKQPKE